MRTRVRFTATGALLALAVVLFSSVGMRVALAGVDGDLVLGSFISNGSCTPGSTNCTSGSTGVTSQGGGLVWRAQDGDGLEGFSNSGDTGVIGTSQGEGGIGVSGTGPSIGVDGAGVVGVHGNGSGTGGIGVSAEGTDYGVYATGGGTGVYGLGLGSNGVQGDAGTGASGVYGSNFGTGNGVRGHSAKGTGVLAQSSSGTALRVGGKVQFGRSGSATVVGTPSNPKSSVVVSNVAVSPKSLVLATAQKNVPGVFVEAAVTNPSAHTITIFLNKPVSTGYPVAWMVIEKP
ncbi:MAG TPA: hypothetical protein VGB19_03640 [Actinomycetota bacterium]